MVYLPSIPQASDKLVISQPEILENFTVLDSTFDIDHYKYSDTTANIGKHNSVTTPDQAGDLTTAANEPRLYATATTTPVGVLQFSRGPSDAVPTPLTAINGNLATLNTSVTTDILDFTALDRCMGYVIASEILGSQYIMTSFFWDGTAFILTGGVFTASTGTFFLKLKTGSASEILALENSHATINYTDVNYSIHFARFQ